MLKELPIATQHYKRTDPVVERSIFRIVEVVLLTEDMPVVAPKVCVLKHDYMLVSV
jgi:hypothetical protein